MREGDALIVAFLAGDTLTGHERLAMIRELAESPTCAAGLPSPTWTPARGLSLARRLELAASLFRGDRHALSREERRLLDRARDALRDPRERPGLLSAVPRATDFSHHRQKERRHD
jgi:hypothetical protein